MAYPTLATYNTSEGLHVLFQYVNDIVPLFTPMLLFAMFIIIMMGTYFSQKRLSNRGDFPSSFAVAGFVTAIIAVVLSVINLINITTLVICVVISVIGVLWLYLSKDK